jgi:hypothetical protein
MMNVLFLVGNGFDISTSLETRYEDDRIFYELYKSGEVGFLIAENIKHFPKEKNIVTPREFIEITNNPTTQQPNNPPCGRGGRTGYVVLVRYLTNVGNAKTVYAWGVTARRNAPPPFLRYSLVPNRP